MSFYDSDGSWSAPGRQPSWERQRASNPPSRSASTSAAPPMPVDANAFALQFEEIERATDNLMKSGKWYPGSANANVASGAGAPARRESMPTVGRGQDYGADHHHHHSRVGGSSRHQSVSDFEGARPNSAGLQGFYAGQRFPGGRQSEAEQVLQAKRRLAAQRERELRNYHQEQQYNRTSSNAKTERSMSPTTMSEDDRRDLIARQHRALYGDGSAIYNADGSRASSQEPRAPSARGPSPLAFDSFGHNQPGSEAAVQMPPRDRNESSASPVSGAHGQQAFTFINEAQQNSRASTSSPNGSPPLVQGQKGGLTGVAPIGTRPGPNAPGGLNKRSTTPLTPSSLSYGFNASDAPAQHNAKDERSASSASNPSLADKGVAGLGSWGSNSGVWGSSKNTLAVQPSVWG